MLHRDSLLLCCLAESIPEIVEIRYLDVLTMDPLSVPLPAQFLSTVSCRFATSRTAAPNYAPIYEKATLVSPETWIHRYQHTEDRLVTDIDNMLRLAPQPIGPDVVGSGAPAVELIYKRVPAPFMRSAYYPVASAQPASLVQTDATQPFLFSTADATDWSTLSLDEDEMKGGYLFLHEEGILYKAKITKVWSTTGPVKGHILVSENDIVPTTTPYANPIISINPFYNVGRTQPLETADEEYPELNEIWHHMLIDYAISRVQYRVGGDVQAAQLRMNRVLQELTGCWCNCKPFERG